MNPKSEADLRDFLQSEGISGEIIQLDEKVRTVAQAAAAMEVAQEQIVKSLLFLVADQPLLVVALGPDRVDKAAIATIVGADQDQIKLCPPDKALAVSGYTIGTIPPMGHDQPLEVLVDERIMDLSEVYAGAGSDEALLRLTPRTLLESSHGRLVNLQAAQGDDEH